MDCKPNLILNDSMYTISTIKTEYESSINSEEASISEDNFEEKLADLESKVLHLIKDVMHDITELKKLTRKGVKHDKENSIYNPRKIFVGNISTLTSLKELKSYFSKFGYIDDAYFVQTYASHSHAFVEFDDRNSAKLAINTEHFLDGRKLRVEQAMPRIIQDESRGYKARYREKKSSRYSPY